MPRPDLRKSRRYRREWLDDPAPVFPVQAVSVDYIQLHKTKHLLTHVLTAAVRRRWAMVGTGDSGETRNGFFVDLLIGDEVDVDAHLSVLEADMRRLLVEAKRFASAELPPAAARELFPGNLVKHALIGVYDEWDRPVQLYDLDGVVDVCDCALKNLEELRAISPAAFMLENTVRLPWRERARMLWVTRIGGVVAGAETCRCPLCIVGATADGGAGSR